MALPTSITPKFLESSSTPLTGLSAAAIGRSTCTDLRDEGKVTAWLRYTSGGRGDILFGTTLPIYSEKSFSAACQTTGVFMNSGVQVNQCVCMKVRT